MARKLNLFNTISGLIDKRKTECIDLLRQAISIKSVSADLTLRPELFKMSEWVMDQMKQLGATIEKRDNPIRDEQQNYPPIIFGQLGTDKTKKTIMIYNHYDVQPAKLSDGWNKDPFELQVEDDKLLGRGTSDDKGPLVGWICLFKAFKEAEIDLPVNFKFCFEGMEESGSVGLEELVESEASKPDNYFEDVDLTLIVDTCWKGNKDPSLCFGLRGVNYFHLAVEGPNADMHSGIFGGAVQEPMTVLMHLMSRLVDTKGKIQIPGIYDEVAPIHDGEIEMNSKVDFSLSELTNVTKRDITVHDKPIDAIMAVGRYPSLSIHGVEGAFDDSGDKTVIPHKVIGKFSIRTVPDMKGESVNSCVKDYLKSEFEKLNSKCVMNVECSHAGKWFYQDPNSDMYNLAKESLHMVWNTDNIYMTQEGGSIPITIVFQDAMKKPVFLLPMGCGDDGQHSTNEKLNLPNFINGIKTYAAFIEMYSQLK